MEDLFNSTDVSLLNANSGFQIGYQAGIGIADRFIYPAYRDMGAEAYYPYAVDPMFNPMPNPHLSYGTNDWMGIALVGVALFLILKGN